MAWPTPTTVSPISMNVGIIGYGYTGQQHARAAIQGVTLKAIAEPDERKRSLADVHSFVDYRSLDGQLTVVGSKGSLKVQPWEGIRFESEARTTERSFFRNG